MADIQQACATCVFVRAYDGFGNCRRLPPKMLGEMGAATAPNELAWAIWPQVNLREDWCGEWQPNVSKQATGE